MSADHTAESAAALEAQDVSVMRHAADPGYLHEAHVILCETLAGGDGSDGNPDDWHEVATELLDDLVAHGWRLFTSQDAEKLLSAYRIAGIE